MRLRSCWKIAGDAEYAVQYQNEAVQLMVQIKLEEEGGV
jgi:hypothetical protein